MELYLNGPGGRRAAHSDLPRGLFAPQTLDDFVECRDLLWLTRRRQSYRHLHDPKVYSTPPPDKRST